MSDSSYAIFAGLSAIPVIISLLLSVFSIVCCWKMFEKAGVEGWKALIPFYNFYCMIKIAGLPGWTFLLMLIPCVGGIYALVVTFKLGTHFGGTVMGVMFLIPFINFGAQAYVAFSPNVEYDFEV